MTQKILIGGFLHETNTFSPVPTTLKEFEIHDEWPGLSRHQQIFENFSEHCNIPISGFLSSKDQYHFECIPSVWASASPSGKVTRAAYEHIVALLLADIKANPDIDGIFLDLHGAMVADHIDDGEGELLKRIRNIVGNALPIVIALDFHANLTQDMLQYSSAMCIYKTYPHIDMFDTGVNAAITFSKLLPFRALRQTHFMMGLNAQCTLIEPLKSIYQEIALIEKQHNVMISLAPGFALADIKDAGPSVAVYANTQQQADKIADQVLDLLNHHECDFHVAFYTPAQAIEKAATINCHPIIFADTQDNSGAGGTSDTMGIFKCLIEHRTKSVIVALIIDPQSAQLAHQAGIGAKIDLQLGEKSAGSVGTPFHGCFKVLGLSDGKFDATPGSYYEGFHIDIGKTAHVICNGVEAIIASQKMQAADRAIFTHLGLDPIQYNILVLKSSVHFRADFMRLSQNILIVLSPGKAAAELKKLSYKNNKRHVIN